MNFRSPAPAPARQAGSSLIEVLIALFLVAVTMLGLLGLQLRALGLQKDSLDRRTAAALVSGFADHITMNFQAFAAGNFSGSMAPGASEPSNASACASNSGGCDAAAAAGREFALFASAVRARLPEGGAWVATDTERTRAVITVAWRDIRRTDPDSGGVASGSVDAACGGLLPASLSDRDQYRCYNARVTP